MHTVSAPSYKRYRFPTEIIRHAIWLYFRFSRSYRDGDELRAERGIVVTDETIRQWCQTFGQQYAHRLRRRRPQTGDTWHLDEVFLKINGKQHYLWRAVDQHGTVRDILVQSRRNTAAAKKFFRTLLKGCQYVRRVIITDKLASYGAAKALILPHVAHRQHKRLNNRAEHAHRQPVSVNARCDASNQLVRPSAFLRHMVPFVVIFVLGATNILLQSIVQSVMNDVPFGTR